MAEFDPDDASDTYEPPRWMIGIPVLVLVVAPIFVLFAGAAIAIGRPFDAVWLLLLGPGVQLGIASVVVRSSRRRGRTTDGCLCRVTWWMFGLDVVYFVALSVLLGSTAFI